MGAFAVLAAQLVVLAAAAVLAWRQLRHARRIREDEARPHVVVDLEVDQPTQDIHIVVSNLGRTTARDVRLSFDPELTSSLDADPNVVSPRDLKPLRDGIQSLPPGKRIRLMLDIFSERAEGAYPDLYHVHIDFHAPALKRDLTDDTVVDLGLYRDALHLVRRGEHDIHERLKELVAEARKWTAFGGGVKVRTREDIQRQQEEFLARAEERERAGAELRGVDAAVARLRERARAGEALSEAQRSLLDSYGGAHPPTFD